MTKKYKILTSLGFIIGLIVLLLNDFVFKELYNNWITGKLSDFAGLFIFPLFWTTLFPKHKDKIFWLTGLLFIFWKSSYSQVLIDTCNGLGLFKIRRIVDYTDLIALLILPVAYSFEKEKKRLKTYRINPFFPFIISVFSFIATSKNPTLRVEKEYTFSIAKDSLKNRIISIDSTCLDFYSYNNFLRLFTSPAGDKYFMFRNLNKETKYTIHLDTITFSSFFSEKKMLPLLTDTMGIELHDKSCGGNYSAHIILKGNEQTSTIYLSGFSEHHANKDSLLVSFEKKIIDKVKNVP